MAIDTKSLQDAIEQLEVSKGISKEIIIQSVKDAMIRGYRKQLGGDDAQVVANFNPHLGKIELYYVLDIVEDVQDDFLQISKEDALEKSKNKEGFISTLEQVDDEAEAKRASLEERYNVLNSDSSSLLAEIYEAEEAFNTYSKDIKAEKLFIPADLDSLKKATVMSIRAVLKQKTAEIEKNALIKEFEGKMNTIITGVVEKADEKGCLVNIGKTTVFLPKSLMIGDERFNTGDKIRLYVARVEIGSKGAHIVVSRADEGFLKCVFTEEISEIYDGTIIIKGIVREAGERSKVAVYSNNVDVDPAGACIGPNGSRIQKIVASLGNGSSKEKIDVITYSGNDALYIMEALKPAKLAGIVIHDNKSATAVVKDDSFSTAIGKRGVNARLAVRLTGYKIDIINETDAISKGISYQTYEELQSLELEAKANAVRQAFIENNANESLPGLPSDYVAPQDRVYEDERTDMDESLEEVVDEIDIVPTKEEVEPAPSIITKEVKDEPVEHQEVKTTLTLSDLEKSLEEGSSAPRKQNKKSNKKKVEESEDSVYTPLVDSSSYMSIYSEEEIEEFKDENVEDDYSYDEDVDYEDYDEYYDDDDR